MRQTTKRLLAAMLLVMLLVLCACAATSEKAPEQAQETAAPAIETAQEAPAKTPEAPAPEQTETAPEKAQPAPAETEQTETQTSEERPPMDEQPVPIEAPEAAGPTTCTVSISCVTLLDHMSDLDAEKAELVPQDGWILAPVTVEFTEGQSAFEVLLNAVKANAIHMEYQATALYDTAYIEGIGGIYEFDCGALSGWMYRVDGEFPDYGCSRYVLHDGQVVEWVYTCDLGRDVGCMWVEGAIP